jgi:Zn-dependent metalloprotease
MRCCSIVPPDVLERLARDKSLSEAERRALLDTLRFEKEWRRQRQANIRASAARTLLASAAPANGAAGPPSFLVYDCAHGTSLPGKPVAAPGADATSRNVFATTTAVAEFYQGVFGRNSVDNAGMSLLSSIHFSVNYNNAFWNGSQMTYGDGDGRIFVDFSRGNDVIGHELTHGVTQYTARLGYTNEAGGLNESMSDVFGSMFRQWQANQSAAEADWLIGAGIMGPAAIAKGYTCLRDMAKPGAKHCLAPQPAHFSKYQPGMDPHYSSGIPNCAFYKAATAIGGRSWEKAGKIWYDALTAFPASPSLKMSAFANRTRSLAAKLFSADPIVANAVDSAWKAVGL